MSEYSGHAEPGGQAIARTVALPGGEVEVRKLSVGPMDNNAYLLTDMASGDAVLIDAANEADRLLAEVGDRRLAAIVTTHGHADHWQALDVVAEATGAPVYLHPADASMVPRRPDVDAVDLTRIAFGGGAVDVGLLHTPGHTPGSVCVLLGETHLFTGDTLFPGGPGRTTSPEDFAAVMRSLHGRIFTRDDDTWVYPGHGDDTTIGAERPHVDEWHTRGW